MKREFLQSFTVGDQPLPKDIIDAIMAQNGQDIQQAKQASEVWEEKYNRALTLHAAELDRLRMQGLVESAITRAGGRNVKAISALLDLETITAGEDAPAQLDAALQALKAESGYLFEAPTPPRFAAGTGANQGERTQPATLAGALRERMQAR